MTDTNFKELMEKDKGCGMSYSALYLADRIQEEVNLLKRKNYGPLSHPTLLPNSSTTYK